MPARSVEAWLMMACDAPAIEAPTPSPNAAEAKELWRCAGMGRENRPA